MLASSAHSPRSQRWAPTQRRARRPPSARASANLLQLVRRGARRTSPRGLSAHQPAISSATGDFALGGGALSTRTPRLFRLPASQRAVGSRVRERDRLQLLRARRVGISARAARIAESPRSWCTSPSRSRARPPPARCAGARTRVRRGARRLLEEAAHARAPLVTGAPAPSGAPFTAGGSPAAWRPSPSRRRRPPRLLAPEWMTSAPGMARRSRRGGGGGALDIVRTSRRVGESSEPSTAERAAGGDLVLHECTAAPTSAPRRRHGSAATRSALLERRRRCRTSVPSGQYAARAARGTPAVARDVLGGAHARRAEDQTCPPSGSACVVRPALAPGAREAARVARTLQQPGERALAQPVGQRLVEARETTSCEMAVQASERSASAGRNISRDEAVSHRLRA